MEEEVREILRNAANQKPVPSCGFGTGIAALFKGTGLKYEIPELRGLTIEPIKFDE
jgi:hypothetical protein